MGISLCMIVRDNEDTLMSALASACDHVDEIVIVDTGSKDRTKNIASLFTDKIFDFEWCDDFSAARNESLKHATQDLVFWMDSDDVVPAQTGRALDIIRKDNNVHAAYFMKIRNMDVCDLGRVFPTEFYNPLKIFPRRPDVFFEGALHERVDNCVENAKDIEMRQLDCHIEHHGYDNEELLEKKILRDIRVANKAKYREIFGCDPAGYFEFKLREYFCFYMANTLKIYGKTINISNGQPIIQSLSSCQPFARRGFPATQPEVLSGILNAAEAEIAVIKSARDFSIKDFSIDDLNERISQIAQGGLRV